MVRGSELKPELQLCTPNGPLKINWARFLKKGSDLEIWGQTWEQVGVIFGEFCVSALVPTPLGELHGYT